MKTKVLTSSAIDQKPVIQALAGIFLACASGAAFAGAPAQDTAQPYVDSITQWGAWELDIEPAAGGLLRPQSRALKARDAKLDLRTNSISALAPTPRSTGGSPPRTPPFGGPSDGFF